MLQGLFNNTCCPTESIVSLYTLDWTWGFSVEAAGTTAELQLFYLFIYFRHSHSLSARYFFWLFFWTGKLKKSTNIMHAFKAWLPRKVQRDESTKIPGGERRWGADLYALTKILFRGWDKNLPCSDKKKKTGTRECYSNNISNTFSSWREYVCWPLHTLALALLKWPICTSCTVFKLQALMSWWKSAAISLPLHRGQELKAWRERTWKNPVSVGKNTRTVCIIIWILFKCRVIWTNCKLQSFFFFFLMMIVFLQCSKLLSYLQVLFPAGWQKQ